MPKASLVGMEVTIVVSNPWEFGTAHGTGPFVGRVLKVGGAEDAPGRYLVLLQLYRPLDYKDVSCEYFIASPRLESGSFDSLAEEAGVDCNLTRIPTDRATSLNPFDLSCWRGGAALLGTLRLKRHD